MKIKTIDIKNYKAFYSPKGSHQINIDVFWKRVKKYKKDNPTRCNLTDNTKDDIDRYIRLVLNPLSHHEINKHEFKNEIQGAITTMSILKTELNV